MLIMLPLMVDLTGKNCVVVGAGQIALNKVRSLLKEKAQVTVISLNACEEIKALEARGEIKLLNRKYELEDGASAFLVIAATNDPKENKKIANHLKSTTLVSDASDTQTGNFHIPSNVKRGKLHLSVSTNGASPKLAKRIKEKWELDYDQDYLEYMEFLYKVRSTLKQLPLSKEEKNSILEEILDNQFKASQKYRNEFYEKLLKNLT